ncbi:class I SAM-dependent methyltransferase [Nonomuraea sp. 10N515B]|uniref:class I SAM-dependent methyltransferase n=1 Tax=Nonomuraea sp. 10N515B TaxID=3457422 RepID=UPI003FCD92F0
MWLARRGWRVMAIDISAVAIARLPDRARALGLDGHITAERHDMAQSFPAGRFDVVSAHYLHAPLDLPREHVLRTAAHALSPGGPRPRPPGLERRACGRAPPGDHRTRWAHRRGLRSRPADPPDRLTPDHPSKDHHDIPTHPPPTRHPTPSHRPRREGRTARLP